MKLQEVILRAIAKKISWAEAADISGLNVATIAWLRRRYEEFGYDGLFSQRRNRRHIYRVPLATAERVLALYQEDDRPMNVAAFCRRLQREHGIQLSPVWVGKALEGAGLLSRSRCATAGRRR